jgi:cytochrome b561
MRKGWSKLSVITHWLIALFIFNELLMAEGTGWAFRQFRGGQSYWEGVWVWHLIPGMVVLGLAAIRFWDRLQGRPPLPADTPVWVVRIAWLTHICLWLALFGMPISGIVAWFGKWHLMGSLHAIAIYPLWAFVVLHVVGALYEAYVRKTTILRRMILPGTE